MASWPATLPQKQFIGLSDQALDAVARTSMDSGPPSRRNRFTAVPRQVKVRIVLTGAQRQTFDSFFASTLSNGALSFDWEDPVTDASVSFVFRGPPKWTLTRGGTPDKRHWEADLDMEIQP